MTLTAVRIGAALLALVATAGCGTSTNGSSPPSAPSSALSSLASPLATAQTVPGRVALVNEGTATLTVTWCAKQNCSTAAPHQLLSGAAANVPAPSGSNVDSVVVEQSGQPAKCALINPDDTIIYLASRPAAFICGTDLKSMRH